MQVALPRRDELRAIRRRYETELFDSVVPFWTRHSPDRVNGGFCWRLLQGLESSSRGTPVGPVPRDPPTPAIADPSAPGRYGGASG